MRKAFVGFISSFAVLFVLSVAAQAEQAPQDEDQRRVGPYITLGGTYGVDMALQSLLREETILAPGFARVEVNGAAGFDSHFGWRFLPWLGAEIQLEYLPGFKVKVFEDGFLGSDTVAKYDILTTMLNGKLTPFRRGRFEPFALFGFGLFWSQAKGVDIGTEVSQSEIAIRAGGGLDIYISDPLAASFAVTYVKPFGDFDGTLDYLSINFGLSYHF